MPDSPTAAPIGNPVVHPVRYFRLWAFLSLFAAAAVSLAVPPGIDLWEGLRASPSPWQAGFLGTRLWQWAWSLGEVQGVGILRAGLVLLAGGAAFSGMQGSLAVRWGRGIGMFAGALSFGALLPWGPGALSATLLVVCLRMVPSRPAKAWFPPWLATAILCCVWPWVDLLFFYAIPLVALTWWARTPPTSRDFSWTTDGFRHMAPKLLLLPLVVHPASLSALKGGEAFAPLLAAWVNPDGYSTPRPDSPFFWLVFLPVVLLFYRHWRKPRGLAAAAWASVWGLAVKPLATMPVGLWIGESPPAEGPPAEVLSQVGDEGAGGSPAATPPETAWGSLILLPAVLWLLLSQAPDGLPAKAARGIREIRPGGWTLLAEPRWCGECAMLGGVPGREEKPNGAGGVITPALTFDALRKFQAQYPDGLVPPFEGNPEPGTDFLLLRPDYPAVRTERPLLPGWRLLSAGSGYALFGKAEDVWGPWVEDHALRAYSPFAILPQEPEARRLALEECRTLVREDPDFFQAVRDAGRMETDFGFFEDAIGHLRTAVQLRPKDAESWNDLAVALQLSGKSEEARAAYIQAIALNPKELLPRLNLAGWAMASGKPEDAEFILADILKVHAGFLPAQRLLIQVLLAQNKVPEARAVAESIPPDSRGPGEVLLLEENAGE